MNLLLAIDRNRQDLLRIVAMLFAAAGLVVGGSVSMLPRRVRNRVLRHLRSAEAALRRLLVVASLSMAVELSARRSGPGAAPKKDQRSKGECKPSFPLIESLPGTGESERPSASGSGPHMAFFDGSDPVRRGPSEEPSPDDAVDAKGLCGRLNAIQQVLENFSKHARHVALWQARRDVAARHGRSRPVRLGRPAGYNARGKHPVDVALTECHLLMLHALRAPDTG